MIFYIIELAGKCHRNSWSHSSGWSNRNPRGKWWVRGTSFRRCCNWRDPFTASWWAVTSWRRWGGTNWWHCRRWGKSDTWGRWWWRECGFSSWCTQASWRSWPGGTWGEVFLTDIAILILLELKGCLIDYQLVWIFGVLQKVSSSIRAF